jgi:hypothetical protein
VPATTPHPSRPPSDREPTAEVRRRTPPQALVDAINPLVRWLAASRFHRPVDGSLVVLHVTGRRTGRHYDIPVGYVRLGDRLLVTTQHRWRTNLRGRKSLDATVCGVRRTVRLRLDEDPVSIARTYEAVIERYGWRDGGRRLGLTTTSGEAPSQDQLEAAARTYRLAILDLSPLPANRRSRRASRPRPV